MALCVALYCYFGCLFVTISSFYFNDSGPKFLEPFASYWGVGATFSLIWRNSLFSAPDGCFGNSVVARSRKVWLSLWELLRNLISIKRKSYTLFFVVLWFRGIFLFSYTLDRYDFTLSWYINSQIWEKIFDLIFYLWWGERWSPEYIGWIQQERNISNINIWHKTMWLMLYVI